MSSYDTFKQNIFVVKQISLSGKKNQVFFLVICVLLYLFIVSFSFFVLNFLSELLGIL